MSPSVMKVENILTREMNSYREPRWWKPFLVILSVAGGVLVFIAIDAGVEPILVTAVSLSAGIGVRVWRRTRRWQTESATRHRPW